MADVHFHDYQFAVDPAHGGTALATLPDRLGPRYSIVNVRDFGAIGNGVDNDAAAIQAAIDHVYEELIGGVLFLPAGTYNLGTTRLRLTPDYASIPGARIMSIRGAGRDVTILKGNFGTGAGLPTSADPNFLCVAFSQFFTPATAASGSSPYSIQDLTIWNTSTAAGSGALCLQFGTRQNLISNCRLIGTMGLYLAESSFGVCVENCLAQHVSTLAGFPSANAYA